MSFSETLYGKLVKTAVKWVLSGAFLAILVGVIALWTPDTDVVTMRAKYGGAPSQFVDLGSRLNVHIRDEGPRDAPVIVLLHGSSSDLRTWDRWTAALTNKYRVVRIDQIGHGLTGPSPTRDYSMAAFVATLDRLVQKLGITKFSLAGSSMGGTVAWNYALAHVEKLDALIMIDTGGVPYPDDPPPPFVFQIAQNPLFRPALLHITPRFLVAAAARSSVADPASFSESSIDRTWELLRYPGNRQATADRQQVPRVPANPKDMNRITVPTLILWGEKDATLPVWGARWFGTHIRGSKVIVYPGIGHLPMEEVPKKSVADLSNWLASLPRRR
jgi:pimeloyl-ACP methyl ester carboxylesterase